MRRTHYFRKILDTGEVQLLSFDAEHFREAGVPNTPEFGMHEVTAACLVNKWNAAHQAQRFVYWL